MDTSNNYEKLSASIREPKKNGFPFQPIDDLINQLDQLGFEIINYEIDVEGYRQFFKEARYQEDFSDYSTLNLHEKSLEHYIAAALLNISEKDVYIDVASCHSPATKIYRNLFKAKTFHQDLSYPPGLHYDMIGGDAANMPVPDNFATKMALHCSFEHFEGDSDIGFIRECGRVLQPGGAMCIIPLYLAAEYCIITDPEIAVAQNVEFEEGVTVSCVKGHNNRFGRYYDPDHLASRIRTNLGEMTLQVFRITNLQAVHPSCYAHVAALIKKPQNK
jgi:hypothetical protein